jgi:hypothetical protein
MRSANAREDREKAIEAVLPVAGTLAAMIILLVILVTSAPTGPG